MPIKFRCPHCQQFLGISRAKAGLVTDCPTCGRTIRVPDLDGSVRPLPKAELDLKDSELTNALDALARLNDAAADAESEARAKSAGQVAPVVALAPRHESAPVPLPEPVALEPALPPERVVAEPKASLSAAVSHRDSLAELASQKPVPRSIPPRGTKPARLTPAMWLAALGAGFLMFAAGFLVGRSTSSAGDSVETAVLTPTPSPDANLDDSAEAPRTVSDPLPAEPSTSLTPALTGRVTYVNADGAANADEGARVIVIPQEREGSAKLAVVGFRAGASAADQQLARTSIRALGGDYVLADAEGRYSVQLPAAGNYHVLIISRHLPRDDAEFLDPNVQRILSDYFDRPASLIGPVAYNLGPFRFQGEEPSPRDHRFDR